MSSQRQPRPRAACARYRPHAAGGEAAPRLPHRHPSMTVPWRFPVAKGKPRKLRAHRSEECTMLAARRVAYSCHAGARARG
eukprot:scaffold11005_cov25-Tisochrysis_lutea.AAC.5